jgi:hypothetical protein
MNFFVEWIAVQVYFKKDRITGVLRHFHIDAWGAWTITEELLEIQRSLTSNRVFGHLENVQLNRTLLRVAPPHC